MHGHIQFTVAFYHRDAGYVSGQYFFQAVGFDGFNHLLRNDRHGHRSFLHRLCLLRSGGDGGLFSTLQAFHHVGEAQGVVNRCVVVRVFLQQERGEPFRFERLVLAQVAQRQQAVGTHFQCAFEVGHAVVQQADGRIEVADVVLFFGLQVDLTQVVFFLGPGRGNRQEEEDE